MPVLRVVHSLTLPPSHPFFLPSLPLLLHSDDSPAGLSSSPSPPALREVRAWRPIRSSSIQRYRPLAFCPSLFLHAVLLPSTSAAAAARLPSYAPCCCCCSCCSSAQVETACNLISKGRDMSPSKSSQRRGREGRDPNRGEGGRKGGEGDEETGRKGGRHDRERAEGVRQHDGVRLQRPRPLLCHPPTRMKRKTS